MSERFFVVGYCPSCGTGPLGVRCCGTCGQSHVLCAECDAMWLTRDTTQPPIFPQQPEVPCRRCGHSLRDPAAQWARWQELASLNWGGSAMPPAQSQTADETLSTGPTAAPAEWKTSDTSPRDINDPSREASRRGGDG